MTANKSAEKRVIVPSPEEIAATEPCHNLVGESYRDIKNRAPETIKTWQELADGYMDGDDTDSDDLSE